MNKIHLLPMALLALMAILAGCSNDSPTGPPAPGSIALSSLVSPMPFKAEDKWHLVYEIMVKNQGQKSIEIDQVEILDGTQRLAMYQGRDLTDLMSSDTRRINAGKLSLIYLWISVAENNIPTILRNHIKFAGASIPETYDVAVDTSSPVVLGPPLKGKNWVAVEISNTSHHRAALDFNGSLRIPQRFAIDWVQIGADDETFSGDSRVNSNYHAYGAEILAVRDGVVVSTKDGSPENTPGVEPPENLETAGGNWILLDMGNNQFALYGHLIPSSLRVQQGQRVRKGDILGLLGNSGGSSEPHLHFHVANVFDTKNSSTLNAEGLPYVFESFEIQRNRPILGKRMLELPLDLAVIRF